MPVVDAELYKTAERMAGRWSVAGGEGKGLGSAGKTASVHSSLDGES